MQTNMHTHAHIYTHIYYLALPFEDRRVTCANNLRTESKKQGNDFSNFFTPLPSYTFISFSSFSSFVISFIFYSLYYCYFFYKVLFFFTFIFRQRQDVGFVIWLTDSRVASGGHGTLASETEQT